MVLVLIVWLDLLSQTAQRLRPLCVTTEVQGPPPVDANSVGAIDYKLGHATPATSIQTAPPRVDPFAKTLLLQ